LDWAHQEDICRLPGRHRCDAAARQASSHRGRCTSAGDWSAGRAPSLAGQLPQGSVCICGSLTGWQAAIAAMRRPDKPAPTGPVHICRRLVGWSGAIAGRPAPTRFGVHLREFDRLSGRHR
jgi:hypothetical protein